MRTRFDQFAKGLLTKALSAIGEVRTQVEIHGEVQAADVLFLPARDHEVERVPARSARTHGRERVSAGAVS